MVKFLRRTSGRYSKLGKKRKKKQVWRRPTGRHNKMREKRRGHMANVSIGYGTEKKLRGTINEKKPIIIQNLNDLNKIKNYEIGVVGNIGKKKKIEIAKKANEMKIILHNINPEKFLRINNKKKIAEQKPKDLPKNEKGAQNKK